MRTLAVYLLGLTVGVFCGIYWPPAHERMPIPPCYEPLGILQQAIPSTQTPHLRAHSLMAHR